MSLTWEEAVNDFITWKRTNGRKEATGEFYHTMLSQFVHWCGRQELPPEEFDRRHLRKYMDWRRGRLSEHSFYSDFRALKTFFRYAKAERYVRVNPFVGENAISLKRPLPKRPAAPTESEADRILKAVVAYRSADCQSGRFLFDDKRSFLVTRDTCIILALIETGARLGEILSLTPENVCLDEVDGKGSQKPEKHRKPTLSLTKTKNGRCRDVPVSVNWTRLYKTWLLRRELRNTPAEPVKTDSVFVTWGRLPIQVPWYSRLFGKYAEFAGCPEWTAHSLRKMRGTALAEINVGIAAEVLGNDPNVLLTHYMVKRTEKVREVWEQAMGG